MERSAMRDTRIALRSIRATVRTGAAMIKRIIPESCAGAIIDVQDFFLSQLGSRPARGRMERNIVNLARLLNYFRIPIVATLERPVPRKGALPTALKNQLDEAKLFE